MIAGGVDVTNTIEVINRNLMQVRIPSTVSTVSTNHTSSEQLSVVIHLATPYGATSRLLIPVAGTAEQSDVNKAIAEVKKTADKSAADVQKVSERFPIKLNWGKDDANRLNAVQGYVEQPGIVQPKFIPVSGERKEILVHQDPTVSPLPIPNPEGVFDEAPIGVTGQLLIVAQIPGSDKKRKFGPWDMKDGKIGGMDLTSENLFTRIKTGIESDLPYSSGKPIDVVLKGYIKFNGEEHPSLCQPVIAPAFVLV